MTDKEKQSIRKTIADSLGIDTYRIKDDSRLSYDLGADSLDIVELTMGLEENHDFILKDEDFDSINTVGDLIKYIEESRK